MERRQVWLDASYFHPRAVDAAPSWVLLNEKGRFTNCDDNATTACAITSAGRTIKVTFWLASPPSVSHLCVYHTESQDKGFEIDTLPAEVCSSSMGLVLLRYCTWRDRGGADYYLVYHAAGGKPSLRAIPCPPTSRIVSSCFGILPLVDNDDDGGEFLLAYLAVEEHPRAYDLRVFSSKTWSWSTRALTLPPPAGVRNDDLPRRIDKVIPLGGNMLGWVDLHLGGGIIACDVLDEDPAASFRFIPLPKSDFYKFHDTHRPRFPVHRDVACYRDGFIVFVDLDRRFRYIASMIKTVRDVDHADVILDSELICEIDNVHVTHVPDGWKIRTCYRHISWNYWRKGHLVDVDDITVYDPRHRTMLSEVWDGGAGRCSLRKLKAKRPILSMQRGDMVYLTVMSKKGHNGRQTNNLKKEEQKLTVGVDLGKKTVEMLGLYNNDGDVQTSTFAQQVNTPPPQQNMWNIDGYYNGSFHGYADAVHPGYGYGSYQHPLLWSPSVPQHLGPSLNSSGSGCIYPVYAQSMYPVPMVNSATHGQQYLPLQPLPPQGPASALLAPFAPPWRQG